MQMDFSHLNVYEIVRIENAELFVTAENNTSLITRGPLSLLYSEEHKWFILKIGHFNYGLNKEIPVLASAREQGAARAYVLLNEDKYYVIKIKNADYNELDRLDEILKNQSDFAVKEGPESSGLPIELTNSSVRVRKVIPDSAAQEGFSIAHWVFKGGKTFRKMMINGAEYVAGGIKNYSTHIDNNYIPNKAEQVPVGGIAKTGLSAVNGLTNKVSAVKGFVFTKLLGWTQTVAENIEKKFETEEEQAEINEAIRQEGIKQKKAEKQQERSNSVVLAGVHSGIMLWQGMAEALDIISSQFSESSSHLVRQKYGPLASECLSAGVGVVGVTGKLPSLPGRRYLKTFK